MRTTEDLARSMNHTVMAREVAELERRGVPRAEAWRRVELAPRPFIVHAGQVMRNPASSAGPIDPTPWAAPEEPGTVRPRSPGVRLAAVVVREDMGWQEAGEQLLALARTKGITFVEACRARPRLAAIYHARRPAGQGDDGVTRKIVGGLVIEQPSPRVVRDRVAELADELVRDGSAPDLSTATRRAVRAIGAEY